MPRSPPVRSRTRSGGALLGNVFFALFWLPVRFFVGRDWLSAGWHKVIDPAWTGRRRGTAGVLGASGGHPEQGRPAITYDWFRQFLQYMLDNGWYTWFAKLIAWGEVLVGLGLLVGALVGIAAFFGTVMNFSFMLAGAPRATPFSSGSRSSWCWPGKWPGSGASIAGCCLPRHPWQRGASAWRSTG